MPRSVPQTVSICPVCEIPMGVKGNEPTGESLLAMDSKVRARNKGAVVQINGERNGSGLFRGATVDLGISMVHKPNPPRR